jgi:Tol biopolymer transport system component
MTTPTRLERTLPDILADLSAGPTPEYLDDVFDRTGPMRQRPGWTFPERWLPMADITRSRAFAPAPQWRLVAVALVLIALILAALLAVVGSPRPRPAPFGPARNGLITYVSHGDLYAGDPVTGQTRALVTGSGDDAGPGYSPDGTRLAFIRATGPAYRDGTPAPVDLYTARDDGTNPVKITPSPINALYWATWAPDSRSLAVTYRDGGWSRLMILDADGRKDPIRVTTPTSPDTLSFRPTDGRQLLFRGRLLYPDDRFGLYVMNVDGTDLRTLVEPSTDNSEDLGNATYSADGARIFYQRWFPDSIQLWVMNADGTGARRFVNEPGATWDGVVTPSPDGRWVAFWHVIDKRSTQRVAVIRADGSGPIIPTGPELSGTAHWVWSPDSTKILMMPDDGSSASAYLLDPSGGPGTNVPWQSDEDLDWQRLAP